MLFFWGRGKEGGGMIAFKETSDLLMVFLLRTTHLFLADETPVGVYNLSLFPPRIFL